MCVVMKELSLRLSVYHSSHVTSITCDCMLLQNVFEFTSVSQSQLSLGEGASDIQKKLQDWIWHFLTLIRAFDWNAFRILPCWGFLGMSTWEEPLEQTQNVLKGLWIPSGRGIPLDPPEITRSVCERRNMGYLAIFSAAQTQTAVMKSIDR